MQFTDEAVIRVDGGNGGNGIISFDRRRNLPKGGPDGGNGGAGGDIILRVSKSLNSLFKFRYQTVFKAGNGKHGMGKKMQGVNGEKLIITVPPGTIVNNHHTGELIANLMTADEELLIAKGGNGGQGNYVFKSSTNRTPRYQTNGRAGEEYELELQLQLLADIGLVGFPNAGKSTLLKSLSNAKPQVASYPFTTLNPQLGIIDCDLNETLVIADIPGLVEGSSQGRGLGYHFLKHLHRTRLMLHLVECEPMFEDSDADGTSEDEYIQLLIQQMIQQVLVIRNELATFSEELATKPVWLVVTKADLLPNFHIAQEQHSAVLFDEILVTLKQQLNDNGIFFEQLLVISSITRLGITKLRNLLSEYQQQLQLESNPVEEVFSPAPFQSNEDRG